MNEALRPNPSTDSGDVHLESTAQAAAEHLRQCLTEAFVAAGVPSERPQQVARHLGLDKSLGWKIFKLVTDPDPVAATRFVPGRGGQRLFIDALRTAGVSEDRVTRVSEALNRLDDVISSHAGDRSSFEMMMPSLTAHTSPEQHEAFRRMAYIGNSAIRGVQCRVHQSSQFVCPSKSGTEGMLDLATICGFHDLRRLRADTPWAIVTARAINDSGESNTLCRTEPLCPDPSCDPPHGGVPVMREFSSRHLPPISSRVLPSGGTRYELDPGPIGNAGACTCVTGWMARNSVNMYRSSEERYGELFVSWTTPAEIAIHEVYGHRELKFAHSPSFHLIGQLPADPKYPSDGRDSPAGTIQIAAEVQRLDDLERTVDTGLFPNHAEIIRTAVKRLGWELSDFICSRVVVRFPPIPTLSVMRHELPTKP